MPSKQNNVPNLDLTASKYNKDRRASQNADGLKPEASLSPLSPRSPKSSPSSPLSITKGSTIRPVGRRSGTETTMTAPLSPSQTPEPATPGLTAMPQYPPSPKDTKHSRDASRSFFSNLKASRSSHKISNSDSSGFSADNRPKSRTSSRDRDRPRLALPKNSSTPDLLESASRAGNDTSDDQSSSAVDDSRNGAEPIQEPPVKKGKQRFANLLSRTRSVRVDDGSAPRSAGLRRPSTTTLLKVSESKEEVSEPPPRSITPIRQDRSFTDIVDSTSHHRVPTEVRPQTSRRDRGQPSMVTSGSLSQVSGASAALFSNLKHTSSGAADRLGKASKGFLGKITRSGSTNEREIALDDNYVCSVINLPLIKQTRKTRISKRLEDCKDKTEFWMPALPYRCIDYLNYKGCEEEGLYRVPGSGKEVKYWQRRFDSEGDINLFDEPELYDINTIGSMFKAWLRELPDEIFPKATQQMIAEQCEGATTAPQLLKDELSKLPPYNYYLLFAITCHLNLLHSYVDQNKMDYRNLCICFQPCMKIDGFCFQFLVCDWKNCWQGCWTEKEWVKEEKEILAKAASNTQGGSKTNVNRFSQRPLQLPDIASAEDDEGRAISSSGSSQAEQQSTDGKSQSQSHSPSQSSSQSRSTTPTLKHRPPRLDSRPKHERTISQLPELGPPLSPIKI
ncbi:hypothetical protein PISL3812_08296 [Talaromyces islandicus]|uniref:Rho-GAP domain-containing protein n=1 Tax=Talaromyces islandicus TaxID=28573 RepID=A0A0U1M6U0_TALIS|nr:hypothetical protein PISL3812_08296 [Talaromyces islandicus]